MQLDDERRARLVSTTCLFSCLLTASACSTVAKPFDQDGAPMSAERPAPSRLAADEVDLGWPNSVADLVRGPAILPHQYDIIAIGVVSSVLATGYLPTPVDLATEDWSFWPPIAFADHKLVLEDVFLDDGTIAANERVVLRVYTGDSEISWFPTEEINDRYLYFLKRIEESDSQLPGEAYCRNDGWGLASRLYIDGEYVAYSDDELTPVGFATGTPPTAFLDAVATEVAAQYPASVSPAER